MEGMKKHFQKKLRHREQVVARQTKHLAALLGEDVPGTESPVVAGAAGPRVSAYAESLLNRKAAGLAILAPVQRTPIKQERWGSEWISTLEASRRTGYSQRHIQSLCEEGFFIAREEWRQRPPIPGRRQGGRLYVAVEALRKLQG